MTESRNSESAGAIGPDFLAGGGQMGKVVAAKDWSRTPLGPIENWPQSLRTTVSLCLASNFPISIAWGPERTQIYNDGYWPICGAKHPHSMGQDFRECWASAWPAIGEAFERAEIGETRFLENQRMFLDRNGYLEETFFTFSFSPIRDESGGVGGLFHPVTETTANMLSERRTKVLRDLAARGAQVDSIGQACAIASEVLGEHELDIPFALMYLVDEAVGDLKLVGSSGLEPGHAASPLSIRLDQSDSEWPVQKVMDSGQSCLAEHVSRRFGLLSCGPYPEPPDKAFVLPILRPGLSRPTGVLIAGVSSRLPLDDTYRGFCDLVAGQFATAVANARVTEEERRRTEALAELDRAKTQFFSNVSHEFRTPLTLMLGPLNDLLEREGETITASREELHLVHRNGQRLLRLVNALLDFSRIEAGRIQAVFEPVDLAALTADVASVFRSAIEKAGLKFSVDCTHLSQPTCIDRSMWEKVILNLLSNAFKFTFEGEIRVVLREIGSAAELSVSDTGTGIPAEALPRLFERFYRVETGHGRTYEGSGIGLSLVQQLVGLHGGAVRVQSEVGAGSTFYVSVPFGSAHLPQDQVRRPESPSSQARNVAVGQGFVEEALRWLPDEIGIPERERAVTGLGPGRRRARIVLADDNADMRQYVQRILATEYDVDAVTNGQEALNLIRQNPPDLVLSDVMMPDLDGFRLLAILRQDVRTRGVPVVLLSARAGEEARIEGLEAGADDYLVKPFGARELLARVRTNLELTQLRSRIARQDEIERTVAVVEQQRRLFDTALSNTPDFIYILDVEGRVTYANRALLALWGRQLHEAVGKNFFDLEHPEALATKLHSQVQQVIVTRQPLSDQTPFASRGGEMRHYEYIFAPVLAADGSVEAVAGSTRDITQRIKAEAEERYRQEQLRESARLESLGVLAGGVAHDFNNLLVGVIGNASLAQDALPPDHAASELIEEVLNAGEQAAHLTRQMLAYSGRGKFVVEPLNLSVLISEMVGLVRPSVPKKISLTLELAENLPAVEVDRGQIQQVLMNLVLNSADAIGSNEGTITVTTGTQHVDAKYKSLRPETAALPAGTYVSIEVRDTGCGMNEATRAKIFEPFFSTKFVGRGLGLAAVAGIVRGHNGVITVSSALDLGSCFTVLFPAAPSGAVPFPTVAVRNEPTGSGTVLLVDDERTVREMAKKALEHYGYAVLIAESGGEAVHLLKRHPGEIAAVVLDLSMPQMSGQEALPQLRTIRPQIKVIVSSGYSETEVLSLFRGQRVSGFIQKPYTPKGLAEKIKSCIG